jgi:hypothetical protein
MIIVSFETIEHLEKPIVFLHAIRSIRNKNTVVFISAPNDMASLRPNDDNPYHLHSYSFEEFKTQATDILGNADDWGVATPVQGTVLLPYVDFMKIRSGVNWKSNTHSNLKLSSDIISSSSNCVPSLADNSFYVGVWGTTLSKSSSLATMSQTSYSEPGWVLEE